MEQDIRWEQRFSNFVKALNKLNEAIAYINANTENAADAVLDEMIREGLIQRFEYTFELAWNVMKDYAAFQGNTEVGGSRDAIREGFNLRLIADGKLWMDMIGSRIKTSHTYNEATAEEIYTKILDDYHPAFLKFLNLMEAKQSGNEPNFNG